MIDWSSVAKDFGGIEIIPFLESRYSNFFTLGKTKPEIDTEILKKYEKNGFDLSKGGVIWYDIFDIPSGCIWNPKSIKKFYQIKKKYTYINGKKEKRYSLEKIINS